VSPDGFGAGPAYFDNDDAGCLRIGQVGPVSAPGAIALAVGVLTWRRLVRGRAGYRSSLSRVQELIRPVHD
jgi:hypothetical protein